MRRRSAAGLAGLALCLVMSLGIAPSLGQSRPPLVFEGPDADVTVSADTAKLGVANNLDQPQTVSLSVRVPEAKNQDGTPAEPTSVVLVAPRVVLGPQQRADVELVANPMASLAPGTYRDVVVAIGDVASARAERGVQVVVSPDAATTALPGVDKWLAVSYRLGPGQERGLALPLKKPTPGAALPKPLGHLSDGSGRKLSVTGTISEKGDEVTLTVPNDTHPGTYEGTIDLTPDDKDTGTVALTVRRTDSVALAALAIGLGLLAAFFGQRRLGVKHQLAKLDKDADAAVRDIKEGDEVFKRTPGMKAFSLGASAEKTLGELRSEVDKLRSRFLLSIDATSAEYRAADALRLSLKDAAKDWGQERQAAWTTLKAELARLTAGDPPPVLQDRPPGALKDTPQWVLTAEELLKGRPLELKELAPRVAKLTATAELVKRWPDLQTLLDRLRGRLAVLEDRAPDMPNSDRLLLERAHRLVNGIAWDAWHAEDPADFAARAAEAELDQAEAAIGQLSGWLSPPTPTEVVAVDVMLLRRQLWALGRPADTEDFGALPYAVPDLSRLLGGAGAAVGRVAAGVGRAAGPVFDGGIVLLAVAAAIWAGLVQLYFDKAFGTGRDYLSALTWGVATKAALDGVASVVGKLRTPLPETSAAPATTTTEAASASSSTA